MTLSELGKAAKLAEKVIKFEAAPRDFIVNPDLDENLVGIRDELDDVERNERR